MARRPKPVLPIAVIDAETDPFLHGRAPHPFAWGWYDGAYYTSWWGPDATAQMLRFVMAQRPHQIFAHNGGRFDFNFFLEHLEGTPLMINSRIVDAKVGQHTMSDSYARMPVPLDRFGGKKEIDISKLESDVRDKHRVEIEEYLKHDCLSLHVVITAWIDKFGRNSSTIASAAFKECTRVMDNAALKTRMTEQQDEKFRSFYYGGRVQVFKLGVTKRPLKMHDANSMYPHVMVKYHHPVSALHQDWYRSNEITDDTDFAVIEGWSKGALPVRLEKGGIHFPSAYARFNATGHEIRMALKHGRLKINKVLIAYTCLQRCHFGRFINPVYEDRIFAKSRDDKMMTVFLKMLMNSTYGKFALNPRDFKDWIFIPQSKLCEYETAHGENGLSVKYGDHWYVQPEIPSGNAAFRFCKPIDYAKGFRNVATAASITGAARAELYEGLCQSQNPLYCDTDAITAEHMQITADPIKLGAWKKEAEGDEIIIGGKKLYAMLGEPSADAREAKNRVLKYGDERCVKLASKGGRLTVAQIRKVAMGEVFTYHPAAPTYDISGNAYWQKRDFRITNPHLVQPFPGELTRGDVMGGLERIGG